MASASFHWRAVSGRRWTAGGGGACSGSTASSSAEGGASGSNGSSGGGSRIAVPRAVRRTRTALTVSTGRRRISVTSATTIGVIAAAKTVPGRHSIGITSAAAALAAPAIRRVLTERPPCVRW